jgi:streptogramin lyase
MKLFRLLVPSLAGLLLAISTLVAFARATPIGSPPLTASETNLLPDGYAQDAHTDASGRLWITEISSKTVREFDPATRAYTLYTGLTGGAQDAQLGPDGNVWWLLEDPQAVARMDIGTRLVTTWPVTTNFGVALTFDTHNRLWFVDGILSGAYRFDPSTHQFCDYALPAGGGGPFIAAHNGAIWLSDIVSSTLGRITPTAGLNAAYTYWPLSFGGGFPEPWGATFAPNGDVWWADRGLGKVGRLEPGANRLTLFGPAGLLAPVQVAYQGGKVWFTDPFSASLGYIDPATAVGTGQHVATPTTVTLVPDCATVGSGTFTASMSTGLSVFSPVVLTTTVSSEGTLYQAPAGGEPFGLTTDSFNVWTTDVGRDTLIRIDTALRLYLPLIRR